MSHQATNIGNLGAPIGGGSTHSHTGEHQHGSGLTGGHSHTQPQDGASFIGGGSAFNAGLGGEHASAGIPKDGAHPIADKFMGQSGGQGVHGAYEGGSTGDALTGQSHASTTGSGHASGLGAGAVGAGLAGVGVGAGAGASAIGGQYAGSGTNDGLTGQSNASTTGAGVGPLGENTGDSHRARDAAYGATAGGAVAAAGTAANAGVTGTGVGPAGGAGGHYSSESGRNANNQTTTSSSHGQAATNSPLVKEGQATGHFGHADQDETRGHPIADPKSLDTGGPHSLVYQESTGKYVHRHELEGKK